MSSLCSDLKQLEATGCKGGNPFLRLPNINSATQINPDGMHTIKDVIERIFRLISSYERKDQKR